MFLIRATSIACAASALIALYSASAIADQTEQCTLLKLPILRIEPPPSRYRDFCVTPGHCERTGSPVLEWYEETATNVKQVNRSVDLELVLVPDSRFLGVEDVWYHPVAGVGDCEDGGKIVRPGAFTALLGAEDSWALTARTADTVPVIPRQEIASDFNPVPPDQFMAQAAEIAAWIVDNSDYNTVVPLPAFVKLPRATLNYVVYSQLVGGYQEQGCINALYLPNVILLAEDLDETACADTLIHEMVHHFQFITGKAFRCTAEAEREAYELQTLWVQETGVGELPSALFMRRLTCDNPHDWSR